MRKHFFAVIMAGGGGTRLWPLSRQARPKQMLSLIGDITLFQETIRRLKGFIEPEKILVVTTKDQAEDLEKETPELKAGNFILEPEPRGTASVVGIAAKVIYDRDPDAVIAILPADHYIKHVDMFLRILETGYSAAEEKYLVTISIEPKNPSTGYGYIHRGERLMENTEFDVYQVVEFKEKPDKATAENYIKTGKYGWNSGMFIWKADVILEEIKGDLPSLYDALDKCAEKWKPGNTGLIDPEIWHGIEAQTVDYGIMEKSKRAATILAGDIGWSDIGDWNSLEDILPADKYGIIHNGKYINVGDSSEVVAYLENPDKLIALQGISDLIIIDTENALLVCKRSDSQKVKEIVANLKKRGMNKFL